MVSDAWSPVGSKGCCKGGSLTACSLLRRAMELFSLSSHEILFMPVRSARDATKAWRRSVSSSNKPTGEVDGDGAAPVVMFTPVDIPTRLSLLDGVGVNDGGDSGDVWGTGGSVTIPREQSLARHKGENLIPISQGNSCPSLEVPRFGVQTMRLWVVIIFSSKSSPARGLGSAALPGASTCFQERARGCISQLLHGGEANQEAMTSAWHRDGTERPGTRGLVQLSRGVRAGQTLPCELGYLALCRSLAPWQPN